MILVVTKSVCLMNLNPQLQMNFGFDDKSAIEVQFTRKLGGFNIKGS